MKQLKLKFEEQKKKSTKEKVEEAILHITNTSGKKRAIRVSTINTFIESDNGGAVILTDNGYKYYARESYSGILALIEKL